MALAVNVMNGAHVSAMSAKAINGNNVNSAVTATGTTITTAADLVADVCQISAGAAGTGVQLYQGEPGDEQVVYNSTSTYKVVYPSASTVAINQLAAGSGMILAPYTGCMFKTITSTQILGFLSA